MQLSKFVTINKLICPHKKKKKRSQRLKKSKLKMQKSSTQQTNRNLKRKSNMYNRVILICLAIFFFVGNYHICNYFYPLNTEEHIENWWIMKMDIYALIICICLVLANLEKTTKIRVLAMERFLSSVGIGLAFSNLIDRHVYNLDSYVMSDIFVVSIIIFAAYIDYHKFLRLKKPF